VIYGSIQVLYLQFPSNGIDDVLWRSVNILDQRITRRFKEVVFVSESLQVRQARLPVLLPFFKLFVCTAQVNEMHFFAYAKRLAVGLLQHRAGKDRVLFNHSLNPAQTNTSRQSRFARSMASCKSLG
jgi:hypothetical protein